jgi:hypothetical protein
MFSLMPSARLILLFCLAVYSASCQKLPPGPQPEAPSQPASTAPPQTSASQAPAAEAVRPGPAPEIRTSAPVIRTEMSPEFQTAFKDAKECRGIRVHANADKTAPDFKVHTSFGRAETPEMEEEWLWTVFDVRKNAEGDFRGAGRQVSAVSAVRDMCSNISDSFNSSQNKK